jgi:hypothetical protein
MNSKKTKIYVTIILKPIILFVLAAVILIFVNNLVPTIAQSSFSLAIFMFAAFAFVYTNANYFFGIRDRFITESRERLNKFYRPICRLEADLKRKGYDISKSKDEIIKELENIEQYRYFGKEDTKESFKKFKKAFSQCIFSNKTNLDQNDIDLLDALICCVKRDIKSYETEIEDNLKSLDIT